MGNMPSVEREEIVALTTLGPHQVMYNPRCLGKECQKTDRLMCQRIMQRAALSVNALALVLAALRKVISSEDLDALNQG